MTIERRKKPAYPGENPCKHREKIQTSCSVGSVLVVIPTGDRNAATPQATEPKTMDTTLYPKKSKLKCPYLS